MEGGQGKEDRGRRTGEGGQGKENRGRRTGEGGQGKEDGEGGQRKEDRGRRTGKGGREKEDGEGGQGKEDRGRRPGKGGLGKEDDGAKVSSGFDMTMTCCWPSLTQGLLYVLSVQNHTELTSDLCTFLRCRDSAHGHLFISTRTRRARVCLRVTRTESSALPRIKSHAFISECNKARVKSNLCPRGAGHISTDNIP